MRDGLSAALAEEAARVDWNKATLPYRRSDARIALWQLLNTLIPYSLMLAFMVYAVRAGFSYWVTLALSVLAALLLVRIFILFHDCCHGSFFSSRGANRIVGHILGILAFTPYENWWRSHARHHACVGNLDRKGAGDVWTMTVEEYRLSSKAARLRYRLFRNPFVMFVLGPIFHFLIRGRFASKGAGKRERYSVLITNIGILAIIVAAGFTIGLKTYLLVQFPVIFLAGSFGIWLFFNQHQFRGVYWARQKDWNSMRASLEGASHYDMGSILAWFSANIGIHHLHHVRPVIPNYNLRRCYASIPQLQAIPPVTLQESLGNWRLKLYDEERGELRGFEALIDPSRDEKHQ